MAETIRGRCARVLGALLLVALAARAEASGARLRWTPSADLRVTGYHVYTRAAGHPYGAPVDVGRPAVQADGNMAYAVNGLNAGQTYYFVVTAYTAAPLESSFSGEIALGTTNPCIIDRCISPSACEIRAATDGSSCDDGLFCNGIAVCQGGTCHNGPAPSCDDGAACTVDHCDEALARCVHTARPACCTGDADCADNDSCTSNERCLAGSCVSAGSICPAASCTDAFCDPVGGCGLKPTPDGVTCESCGVLAPRRLIFSAHSLESGLHLSATFATDVTIDLARAGFTLEILGSGGTMLYSGTVPPEWFNSKRDGTRFRFLAAKDQIQTTNGITGVVLRQRHEEWSLTVRAASTDLSDALVEPPLAVTLLLGDLCMSDAQITCQSEISRAICR